MKNILTALVFFMSLNLVAQLKTVVKPEKIKSQISKKDIVQFFYIEENPKIMVGNYSRESKEKMGSASWTTKISITLNEDGTCNTSFYKSSWAGRPAVNKNGTGKWGLIVDPKTNKLKTKAAENGTWYEIVLISDSEKTLPYYDRKIWYDKILITNDNEVYLKLIFSSKGKIKKS